MTFEIADLRQRPEFFEVVADRIWQAWWRRHGVTFDYIAGRLREVFASNGVPFVLVAHRQGQFLGTASVITSDLDARPQYTPWVAAVWTEPDARGSGVAGALVGRAAEGALAAGYERVYLCAAPVRRAFYERLGWVPIEEGVGTLQLTVFERVREPAAA